MERKFHLFWAVLADSGFPPGRGIVRFYAAFEAGDSDGDGLNDAFETLALGTSTNSPDSDGDGVSDATEYAAGIDPVVKGAPVCDALGCRKGAPFSIEDAAAIANPHFKEGPEFKTNCQRCVQAYELARRGYDVEAHPSTTKARTSFGTEIYRTPNGGQAKLAWPMQERSVRQQIANAPVGARFVVYRMNDPTVGHVIVAENTPSGVRYVDPQNPAASGPAFFSQGMPGMFGLLRTDNLTIDATKLQGIVKRG